MSKTAKLSILLGLVLVLSLCLSSITIAKTYDIAVIVKATDSDFWQVVLKGAETAGKEMDNVTITTFGPTSEADIAKQVSILENVITRRPDAIVLASTSSDATVPVVERAYDMGIKIILIDNLVHTDKYHSFLATDNIKGGALAADKFVEFAKEMGKSLSGKVGLISAMAGVQVLIDRDKGFKDRLNEIAPDLEILETRYVNNRIPEALGAAEDIMTRYPEELVGFFADNNHTGDGVARAIAEAGVKDEKVVIAYDADPEEIRALQDGVIKALIVQDPFGMGYKGVKYAVKALEGETLPKYVDTGVTAVTKENFNDEEIQLLMFPDKRAKAILGE